jgi:hypothetical protein
MSQFFDQASLVMVPSGYKDGKVYSQKPLSTDGELTFSRASSATRVGPDGLIEKVRTNLFPYSQDFSTAAWAAEGTMSETFSQTDPNGGTTAVLVSSGTSGNGYYYHNITCVANVPNTFSIYIKGSASGAVSLRIDDSASAPQFNINYTTSWQRFSITSTPDQTGCTFVVGGFNTWEVGKNLSFAFAQHETGDIATDYIATTTAAVSVGPVANLPRLDYLGSSCPRLLLEPQRTNIVTFSEQFDNAANIKTNNTITANATTSPDGYTNADKVIPTATSGFHSIDILPSVIVTNYTLSVFAKAGEYSKIALLSNNRGTNMALGFDLDNGTTFANDFGYFEPTSFSIENYGNGWYRCSITYPKTSTGISGNGIAVINDAGASTFAGNGTDGLFLYGFQMESDASYVSSYIPTLGAAVTRGADSASKTGISSLIGQTEGTLFVEVNVPSIASAGTYANFALNDGTSSNILDFTYYPDGRIQAVAIVGGSITVNINLTSYGLTAGNHKIAFAYKLNDYVLYVDGTQAGADTSSAVPAMSKFDLYLGSGSTQVYNQALLFKTRLSNADLATLTTI